MGLSQILTPNTTPPHSYGQGAVSGKYGQDTLTLFGDKLRVAPMKFAAMSSVNIPGFSLDGLVGLGFAGLLAGGLPADTALLENLRNNHLDPENREQLKLNDGSTVAAVRIDHFNSSKTF